MVRKEFFRLTWNVFADRFVIRGRTPLADVSIRGIANKFDRGMAGRDWEDGEEEKGSKRGERRGRKFWRGRRQAERSERSFENILGELDAQSRQEIKTKKEERRRRRRKRTRGEKGGPKRGTRNGAICQNAPLLRAVAPFQPCRPIYSFPLIVMLSTIRRWWRGENENQPPNARNSSVRERKIVFAVYSRRPRASTLRRE